MPLIIITGLPCSGKTYRAEQIAAGLTEHISSTKASRRTVQIIPSHHASDDTGGSRAATDRDPLTPPQSLRDQIYNDGSREKTARAAELSAIKRAISRDNIVVADGLNYIKGYRYQLWCEAKAAGTRCCVVHVAAREDECRTWNRERLRAWGVEDGDGCQPEESNNTATQQGETTLGDLVPESHTAVYGDRVADDQDGRSRSSSLDGMSGGGLDDGGTRPPDTRTLKSLYLDDRNDNNPDPVPDVSNLQLNPQSIPDGEPAKGRPTNVPPPPPTSAAPYSPATLRSLVMRYEPPSPFSRWDTPLFTLPSTDARPPVDDIWAALYPAPTKPTSKKALSQIPAAAVASGGDAEDGNLVKPHAATVLPQATGVDALQTLEAATMDVVRQLLAQARAQGLAGGEGGVVQLEVPLPAPPPPTTGAEPRTLSTDVHLPAGLALSQPMLQRLRRKYTQIQRGGIAHGQGHVRGRRQAVLNFVAFLEAEWNQDDDDEAG